MNRFRVIEVTDDKVRIEDTHMPKDKYGRFPTSDYHFIDSPFQVGDEVDIIVRLKLRPEPKE